MVVVFFKDEVELVAGGDFTTAGKDLFHVYLEVVGVGAAADGFVEELGIEDGVGVAGGGEGGMQLVQLRLLGGSGPVTGVGPGRLEPCVDEAGWSGGDGLDALHFMVLNAIAIDAGLGELMGIERAGGEL